MLKQKSNGFIAQSTADMNTRYEENSASSSENYERNRGNKTMEMRDSNKKINFRHQAETKDILTACHMPICHAFDLPPTTEPSHPNTPRQVIRYATLRYAPSHQFSFTSRASQKLLPFPFMSALRNSARSLLYMFFCAVYCQKPAPQA